MESETAGLDCQFAMAGRVEEARPGPDPESARLIAEPGPLSSSPNAERPDAASGSPAGDLEAGPAPAGDRMQDEVNEALRVLQERASEARRRAEERHQREQRARFLLTLFIVIVIIATPPTVLLWIFLVVLVCAPCARGFLHALRRRQELAGARRGRPLRAAGPPAPAAARHASHVRAGAQRHQPSTPRGPRVHPRGLRNAPGIGPHPGGDREQRPPPPRRRRGGRHPAGHSPRHVHRTQAVERVGGRG